ncbi:MAG: HU family DNA-binding protein [Parcubacteria group bacterium]|nr:HU family DNA-binding protein [Parcubacteria group bacterium]
MNKAELINLLSEKTGISKRQTEDMLELMLSVIIDTMKKGDEVTLTGFGTFSARTRASRMGVNPQNPSEKIQIPEVRVPKFKAGKTLKDALKAHTASSHSPSAPAAPAEPSAPAAM